MCESMELTQSLSQYRKVEKLGEGTYGEVYVGMDIATNDIVAIKQIRLAHQADGISSGDLREVTLLKATNHINIIKMREAIIQDGRVVLILEFMDTNLRSYLNKWRLRPLNGDLVKSYAYQILCGCAYLHSNRIIHRDLKPENILINKCGILKVSDFGLARIFSIPITPLTPHTGSTWYSAPEMLMGTDAYGVEVDVWSAGCVIAEMARGIPLFPGDSDIDQIAHIFQAQGTPTEEEWPDWSPAGSAFRSLPIYEKRDFGAYLNVQDECLTDLLCKLLALNPEHRITAVDALSHPYFASIPESLKMCIPEIL